MSFHKLFKIRWRRAFNGSAVDKKDLKPPPPPPPPHPDFTSSVSAANKEEIGTPAGLIGWQQRSGAHQRTFGPI